MDWNIHVNRPPRTKDNNLHRAKEASNLWFIHCNQERSKNILTSDYLKSKLSRTMDTILNRSLQQLSIKNEFKHGMNNLMNTYLAFNTVASNKGCGTPGIDSLTIDGMDLNKVQKYHESYIKNRYDPKPVKRIYIPKSQGKTRPLGIPTIKDRTLQKAMEQILTPYFENIFSEWSFGFRTKKSCLDAIKRVKQRFKGIDYIIKFDIEGYFGTINHDILLKMLNKYIKKEKVLRTIIKWLKAGYIEDGIKYNTISGSPQGGVISPLLSNIYLNYIDKKMEKLIETGKPQFKMNPTYQKLHGKGLHQKCDIESTVNLNPNTRVEYIRYADDFIIGVKGEKHKAEAIKNLITQLLEQDLHLKINKDKSKIMPANKGTRFLSYMIKIRPTKTTRKKKTHKDSLNGRVQIQIPREKIKEYGKNYGWVKENEIVHDRTLINRENLEIIRTYKTIVRGITQYFCLANNLAKLTYLNYLAEYSCLKTLAGKYRTSIARVRKKLNIGVGWGVRYKLKSTNSKIEKWETYSWERIKRMRNHKGEADITINPNLFKGRTKLTDRLTAQKCEVCLNENLSLQIHHVGTVRDANWRNIMNKKTVVLCVNCHRKRTNQQIHDIKNHKNKRLE